MATSSADRQLQQLRAENKRLRRENDELKKNAALPQPSQKRPRDKHYFRQAGSILAICFAAALLFVGNLLLWTGNTIVKTDRYVEATAPLIQNQAIQDALANKLSQQLYQSVDIEQIAAEALPPRAQFLAPTLSDQFKQHTNQAIHKIIAGPRFQELWDSVNQQSHDRFIAIVNAHGDNGSIDISEFYTQVSQRLKDTKLAFLADKPLPPKIGEIELVQGNWLTVLQTTIQNIDAWRVIILLLLVATSALGIWLSRNRRRATIMLGSLFAFTMFISLVSVRLGREILASHVDPQYSEAARQAYAIVLHPLQVQTATILGASLLIVFIAWIGGNSSSSRLVRQKVDQLFSGKLHTALFAKENGLTLWIGRHKRTLQWLVVATVALMTLFIRLTPVALLWDILLILILILLLEILAAQPPGTKR